MELEFVIRVFGTMFSLLGITYVLKNSVHWESKEREICNKAISIIFVNILIFGIISIWSQG